MINDFELVFLLFRRSLSERKSIDFDRSTVQLCFKDIYAELPHTHSLRMLTVEYYANGYFYVVSVVLGTLA